MNQGYRAGDVIRATGVNRKTLEAWRSRGLVLQSHGERDGRWAIFSDVSVLRVAALRELVTLDIGPTSETGIALLNGMASAFAILLFRPKLAAAASTVCVSRGDTTVIVNTKAIFDRVTLLLGIFP